MDKSGLDLITTHIADATFRYLEGEERLIFVWKEELIIASITQRNPYIIYIITDHPAYIIKEAGLYLNEKLNNGRF